MEKNVVAFAHFAKEIFRQKTMGRFDNHIFAHLGKPCNETIAFMTALYKFFEQSIELSGIILPAILFMRILVDLRQTNEHG